MTDTTKSKNSRAVLSPEFRMSFPQLIEAKKVELIPGKPQGDPIFSVSGIFTPENVKKFRAPDPKDPTKLVDVDLAKVIFELAKAEWGDSFVVKELMATTWPITDGTAYDEKQKAKGKNTGEAYVGMKLFNMKAQEAYPPTLSAVIDDKLKTFNRAVASDMQVAKQLFAGGNYAIAELNLKPYKIGPKKDGSFEYYVTAYMNNVRFVREGERFGGQSLMSKFGGTEGGTTNADPTKGIDDEIPV